MEAQETNSDTDPRYLEFWDRGMEGQRRAGLPESE